MPFPTYRISMLGARGVGKTSVLATMYNTFDSVIGSAGLRMGIDTMSEPVIAGKLAALLRLCQPFPDGSVSLEVEQHGLSGDRIESLYHFFIARRSAVHPRQSPDFGLDFYDYPGGFLVPQGAAGAEQTYERVVESVRASQVIVVAIDAPYMMEPFTAPTPENAGYHALRNCPDAVARVVRTAIADDHEPRLFLLAPIRCEKYMQNAAHRGRLVDAVRDGYAELLDFLGGAERWDRCRVVTTPVETTGCVWFDHWRAHPGSPAGVEAVFRHRDTHPSYSPELSEQPFCHTLAFALALARERRRPQGRLGLWLEILASLLGFPPAFVDAIERVGRRSIVDESRGLAILQPGPVAFHPLG
jgi:hypothetical protein